ncbi:hypothetical protein K450DRAFT_231994 [Umbelopsis ramanniana AG]|uniref:Uncharacterized protein n=1 Tax=Umbelopsis ramanniana AG TaxID=1314678 RepID=A0AAD5ECU1_UMBRA|nr:uncharacterized protein K450DRAFT_231994 [Umbelopsis ramanniana AG]KAI8581578.1 hypothetical protein K450DRAFT_231994 [Umbelopsis ramanniana AG]
MPIPATAPIVLTTTTPLPIVCPVCRDSNSCPKHCSNKVFTKSYEMVERELKTRSSVEQPKRAPSLACRSEDEQWVDISNQRLRCTKMGALYPGSKFKGVQKSGKTSYEVAVEIQHVDLAESCLSGYLNIKGLTTEFPELTTFFEAEIIGPKHSFLTRKWQAEEQFDYTHWKRFPAFQPYLKTFNQDGFAYDFYDKDFIFMRWKEHFLVSDHHLRSIDGASYDGFYYICYQRSTNQITGYYFHHQSEWFQHLTLEHVEERSFGTYEFR